MNTRVIASLRQQAGAALVLTLVVLAGLALVGAAAARSAVVGAQMARHGADQLTASAAAYLALADAERELRAGSRAALLRDPDHWPRIGCGHGPMRGVCVRDEPPAWRAVDLVQSSQLVAFGEFTGAILPTGVANLPARLPRYLIEVDWRGRAGDNAAAPADPEYRITAVGHGADARTLAVVQSTFRPEPP